MSWIPFVESKQSRYEEIHGELDERGMVRLGNVAYAAALGSLMAGDRCAAIAWFCRAAERWRESYELGTAPDSWGRPIGVIKALLLAGDDQATGDAALWALEQRPVQAESPIGRYAAALALLSLGRRDEARGVASSLQALDAFPDDVAAALHAIAEGDQARAQRAVDSVVRSFETRDDYLEEAAVADTALVLVELGRRNTVELALAASPVLP